jgi:hypothetical protein
LRKIPFSNQQEMATVASVAAQSTQAASGKHAKKTQITPFIGNAISGIWGHVYDLVSFLERAQRSI